MTCHQREDPNLNDAIWFIIKSIILVVAAAVALSLFFVFSHANAQLPPLPAAPAPKPLAQSPKGAALAASFGAPMVISLPPATNLVLTVNNTNPFTVQACTLLGGKWFTLTNGTGSVTIPMAWLNTFTNPFSFSKINLAWNASADPTVTGYDIYWGSSSNNLASVMDCGNVTNYSVTLTNIGAFWFAATSYNSARVQSAYSNEVSGTNQTIVPPVTVFFQVKQTNVVAPLVKIATQ